MLTLVRVSSQGDGTVMGSADSPVDDIVKKKRHVTMQAPGTTHQFLTTSREK